MADYPTSVAPRCESWDATSMLPWDSTFASASNETLAEKIIAVLLRGQPCQHCSSGSFAAFAPIASPGRTAACKGRSIRSVSFAARRLNTTRRRCAGPGVSFLMTACVNKHAPESFARFGDGVLLCCLWAAASWEWLRIRLLAQILF